MKAFAYLMLFAIIPLGVFVGLGRNHSNSFIGSTNSYATEYNVDPKNVVVIPKPHDCDWTFAPLGNKGCHYVKQITDADGHEAVIGKTRYVFVAWQKVEDK